MSGKGLSNPSRTLQTFTQQETVTPCLLFILQPIYLHKLSPHMSSQPITLRIYQRLLYLLTNRSPGVFEFSTNTTTWLWRWLPHRLSKRQSITTVLLRTPITQMIFFNQGMLLLGSNHFLIDWLLFNFIFNFSLLEEYSITSRMFPFHLRSVSEYNVLYSYIEKIG